MAGNIVDNGLVRFNYSGPVTVGNAISGNGNVEIVAGTAVVTSASIVSGTVTIDPGATMQWGAGNVAFLAGGNGGVVDNGTLVLNLGGGSISGSGPVSGTGSLTLQSGSVNTSGVSTYTGATTINSGAIFALTGPGSIANSSGVFDQGSFDISGTTVGASIQSISGSGTVSLGGKTLTLTNASGIFSGVMADGGTSGGTGGGLTIAGGTETLTGTNTYTGATTINGSTLIVNGSIASSSLLTVNAGGTVGGTGILPSTVIGNGGTLAPGNFIGTIMVQGNLIFNAGSMYAVELSPSAADRTNVTGTATLAGAVNATFAPGSYMSRSYTILSAAGGLGGTSFNALTTSNTSNFNTSLSYTSTDVLLNLTAALGAAAGPLNSNQQSVASAINAFFNGGGTLPPAFSSLFGMTGANLTNALRKCPARLPRGHSKARCN